jgi:hypothetical protein
MSHWPALTASMRRTSQSLGGLSSSLSRKCLYKRLWDFGLREGIEPMLAISPARYVDRIICIPTSRATRIAK